MKKKILVIGSGGQLGTDLSLLLANHSEYNALLFSHRDFDITSENDAKRILLSKPDIIINCSAYHKVDDIEFNPSLAFSTNVTAVWNLAKVCKKIHATLIQMSTDYVFPGNKKIPYKETDKVSSINIYGLSRIAGELAVTSQLTNYFIIRTAGLYGLATSKGKQGGNFVELIINKASSHETITVVNDQITAPTYTKFLAAGILSLIHTNKYGIYHMTATGQVSWYAFTNEILRIAGLKATIIPTTTERYNAPAKRPLYSVLSNEKITKLGIFLPDWNIQLKEYMKDRQ